MNELLRTVTYTLLHLQCVATSESRLHERIAHALTLVEVPFEREVKLSTEDRIDFVIGGSIGLEVKIEGSLTEVTRQLHRYVQHDRIDSVVLVTTRARHKTMPFEMNGKRIEVVHLVGASL